MGARDSSSLRTLTEDVQKELVGLPANLRKSLYMDNAVSSLYPSVAKLGDMIQKELRRNPYYTNRKAVTGALNSLRSVEGTIELLITASKEYATARDLAEKHEIQDTWINRKNRLVNQADLCAISLDVVLALADELDSRAPTSEPTVETKAGSNFPDNTTARKHRGRAS
jgi:hypothetical protein